MRDMLVMAIDSSEWEMFEKTCNCIGQCIGNVTVLDSCAKPLHEEWCQIIYPLLIKMGL